MNSDCIFCKIIAGEVSSAKVYEDGETLAFLDISPIVKGHTLVIPKTHVEVIEDAPTDALAAVMRTVRTVVRAQREALGADGMSITQANGEIAGQVVPHLHFHVIPRFARDGKVRHWKPRTYDNSQEMDDFAQRLGNAAAGEP